MQQHTPTSNTSRRRTQPPSTTRLSNVSYTTNRGTVHTHDTQVRSTSSAYHQQPQTNQDQTTPPTSPAANMKTKRARRRLDPLQHYIHHENDHFMSILSGGEPLVNDNGEQPALNQVVDHITEQFGLEPHVANTDYTLQDAANPDSNYQYQYDGNYNYEGPQLQGDLAGIGSQFDQQLQSQNHTSS